MPTDLFFMNPMLPTLIATAGAVGAVWLLVQVCSPSRRGVGRPELERIHEALEALRTSVEDLREDIQAQSDDMREISGRVEFAERLLTERSADAERFGTGRVHAD